jgi:hypothetical protein
MILLDLMIFLATNNLIMGTNMKLGPLLDNYGIYLAELLIGKASYRGIK